MSDHIENSHEHTTQDDGGGGIENRMEEIQMDRFQFEGGSMPSADAFQDTINYVRNMMVAIVFLSIVLEFVRAQFSVNEGGDGRGGWRRRRRQ